MFPSEKLGGTNKYRQGTILFFLGFQILVFFLEILVFFLEIFLKFRPKKLEIFWDILAFKVTKFLEFRRYLVPKCCRTLTKNVSRFGYYFYITFRVYLLSLNLLRWHASLVLWRFRPNPYWFLKKTSISNFFLQNFKKLEKITKTKKLEFLVFFLEKKTVWSLITVGIGQEGVGWPRWNLHVLEGTHSI